MIRWIFTVLLGAAALAVTQATGALPGKPNIIYILADDLGYGDLGCYGQKVIQTPHIDALCAGGMKFTNHHSGSTVCAPSRSCLLTGTHTGHTWVRANGNFQLRPDPEDITVARLLKDAGYRTAMIGKSGTGCDTDPGQSNAKGFDYFYGFNGHGAAHHYFPPEVYRNADKVTFPHNQKHTGDTYIHDEFLREALAWLGENKGRPFFLHYAAILPHASLVAPEEWVARYRGKVDEAEPTDGGGYAPCKEPKATFAGMVSRLDWEVGEIMKRVQELGLEDNTVIFFASDNGPHSAGGHQAERFDSNGPLRGEKRDLFEGGVRVPFIARWPGTIKAGSVSDHLSAFWDLLPTACDLAGARAPARIDGISFLPTLLGQNASQKQHDFLYWEFYEKGGKRAALKGRWKAVQLDMDKGGGKIMLFDIGSDLSEEKDVASAHPEIVAQFTRLFAEAHTPSPNSAWNNGADGGRKKKKK